jgi:hypothetical protein
VARGEFEQAYRRLAPEVARGVTLNRFREAAQPLRRRAIRKGTMLNLYKLGVRLEGKSSRLFYSFAFAADSALKTPSVLLEVTFRDTASRQVLDFAVREQAARRVPVKPGFPAGRKQAPTRKPVGTGKRK